MPEKVKEKTARQNCPRDKGVSKLSFRLADREALSMIPECMTTQEQNAQNRGPVEDIWDKGATLPDWLTSWATTGKSHNLHSTDGDRDLARHRVADPKIAAAGISAGRVCNMPHR